MRGSMGPGRVMIISLRRQWTAAVIFLAAAVLGLAPATAEFSPTFQFMQALKKQDFYGIKTNVLKGANVNARDDDGTPALVLAAGMGEAGVVRFLIEQGANVDATSASNKETALMRAAASGDKFSTAVLLYFKANPNLGDKLGETALMKAVRSGNADVIKLFIDAKADLMVEDNTGHTALDYAKNSRKSSIVKLLTDAGAEY